MRLIKEEVMATFSTGRVTANGISFGYFEKGQGPLLLCLHGFPDTPRSFHYQIDYFSKRGYHVVAPFLRGYAPTEIAEGSYQTAVLGEDALELIGALGYKDAVVWGHDWGATIANSAAILDPGKINALITMAIPFGTMKRALLSNYEQQRRSWYIFFFQLPIAELAVSLDNMVFLDRLWKDWSVTVAQEELDFAKETLRQPGVLSAALKYYRHMMSPSTRDPAFSEKQKSLETGKVPVKSLYLHGAQDACAGVELLDGMEDYFTAGLEKVVIPGAGHFLHLEKPSEVNQIVARFLLGE
jgi:pimeloyl-ACP methyl ester carboxylesterase